MAKAKVKTRSDELRAEIAKLESERAALQARQVEIRALRAQAADPDAQALDLETLRVLAREGAEIADLLGVLGPRLHALRSALVEA